MDVETICKIQRFERIIDPRCHADNILKLRFPDHLHQFFDLVTKNSIHSYIDEFALEIFVIHGPYINEFGP